MTVIRGSEARRTVTPNGVMTTYASPSQGGTELALWRVEMAPGAHGPVHAMDGEQVWTVLDGGAVVDVEGRSNEIGPGDTVVLGTSRTRQVAADPVRGLTAIVAGRGAALASGPGREPVVPPWIA